MASQAADTLMDSLNLTKQSFTYLAFHGALDVAHSEFYEGIVNKITDEKDKAQLIHSAKVFYKLYGDIFRTIESDFM